MKRLILICAILVVIAGNAQAARRIPRPIIGVPVNQTVTDGFAIDVKDCYLTTPYATATDNESISGTIAKKTSGDYDDGQIACPVNIASGTYYATVKARLRGTTFVRDRVFWFGLTPFRAGFQNDKATIVSVSETPPASFEWINVAADLNFSTFAQGTARQTFALGSGSIIYLMANSVVEFDCIYLSTSSSATPTCPTEPPAAGVVFDAVGAGDGGTSVSSLSWSHTVSSDANRVLIAGVCHRTSTNTITSVSSSVDGAFTLLDSNSSTLGSTVRAALYKLINPTAGAHTITVSFSSAQNATGNSASYEGVSQTAPFGSVTTLSGSSDVTIGVAGSTDKLALAHLCSSDDGTGTYVASGGQTERWQESAGFSGSCCPNRISAFDEKPGDTSVNLGWDITATAVVWIAQGMAINPVAGAGDPPVLGTPSATLVGVASATVEATVDQTVNCTGKRGATGGPYTDGSTATVGNTAGKCIVEFTGLSSNTEYFYVIEGVNANGTGTSIEGTFTTDTPSSAATGIGWTDAEKAIWATRRTSGPYKSAWDTIILPNANAFVASQPPRYTGQTTQACFNPQTSNMVDSNGDNTTLAAALVYFVTGTTSYSDLVRQELLEQAAVAGTDFSNTARWCTNSEWTYVGYWRLAGWMTRLALAYDFTKATFSGAEQTTVETWFANFTNFVELAVHNYIIGAFPNRLTDNYTCTGTYCPGALDNRLFATPTAVSAQSSSFMRRWENITMTGVMAMTATAFAIDSSRVGHRSLNMTTIKARAKRAFEEWMKYAVVPGSYILDEYRWIGALASGWFYPYAAMGSQLIVADIFARNGDSSLYNFSTETGLYGTESVGAPKTVLQMLINHSGRVIRQNAPTDPRAIAHYGSNTPTSNPAVEITWASATGSRYDNHQYMSIANKFFNNATVREAYLIDAPSPQANTAHAWYYGPWGVFPHIQFMFHEMEGLVDPYP